MHLSARKSGQGVIFSLHMHIHTHAITGLVFLEVLKAGARLEFTDGTYMYGYVSVEGFALAAVLPRACVRKKNLV